VFRIQTTQLPKGITHSYKLGIVQTQRHWKGYSKKYPTISGNTYNSSSSRSYDHLNLTKT
ncbi:hypothetical protein MTR67_043585, partial [Solanum verrucosum]